MATRFQGTRIAALQAELLRVGLDPKPSTAFPRKDGWCGSRVSAASMSRTHCRRYCRALTWMILANSSLVILLRPRLGGGTTPITSNFPLATTVPVGVILPVRSISGGAYARISDDENVLERPGGYPRRDSEATQVEGGLPICGCGGEGHSDLKAIAHHLSRNLTTLSWKPENRRERPV